MQEITVKMKTLNFRWVVKEPDKNPEERNFTLRYYDEDDLTAKQLMLAQKLVGGYVEVAWLGGDVKVLINEEGLLNNLPANCGFVGTIVFFHDTCDGSIHEWDSLSDEEIRKVKTWIAIHGNDPHIGYTGMQIITEDEAIASYRQKLQQERQKREKEWNAI